MVSIESKVFLALHCSDKKIRLSAKNLIIQNLANGILIPCEEIGKIDNHIWKYASCTQEAYFRFMDSIMLAGTWIRSVYSQETFQLAIRNNISLAAACAAQYNVLQHYTLEQLEYTGSYLQIITNYYIYE